MSLPNPNWTLGPGPFWFDRYIPTEPTEAADGPIVVLGAGIVGLTTSLRLLLVSLASGRPSNVHIIGSGVVGTNLAADFASGQAGAHHLSFAADDDERQKSWDRRTFQYLLKEHGSLWAGQEMGPSIGMRKITQTEYYDGDKKHLKFLEEYPDFVVHPRSELPPWATHSASFTSVTLEPLKYLHRVTSMIVSLGGKLHQGYVRSLDSLSDPCIREVIGDVPPRAVVVCVGLGARDLIGCGPESSYSPEAVSTREKPLGDPTVFPTRGQTVLIRAPWVKHGYTRQIGGEGGARTYVIPRANGQVVLGGTREVDDWDVEPREETTIDILRRCLEICPELRPPAKDEAEDDGSTTPKASESNPEPIPGVPTDFVSQTDDPFDPSCLLPYIISVPVGLRPSRKAGIRLERGDDIDLRVNTPEKEKALGNETIPEKEEAPAKGDVVGKEKAPPEGEDTLERKVRAVEEAQEDEDFGLGKLNLGASKDSGEGDTKQPDRSGLTRVVFCYGHGGAGWQSCWGTAEDVVKLIMDD